MSDDDTALWWSRANFHRAQAANLNSDNTALRAAIERARALHVGKQAFYPNWDGAVICQTCNTLSPCPTLRALEGTP